MQSGRSLSSSSLAAPAATTAQRAELPNAFQHMMSPRPSVVPATTSATRFRPPARELESCSADADGQRAGELLARDGVVVFRAVASAEDLAVGEALFWDWLESTDAGRAVGLRRGEPLTHKSSVFKSLGMLVWFYDLNARFCLSSLQCDPVCIGYANTGVMTGASVGQSRFLWHCRNIPGVAKAFGQLWGVPTNELVTSFDGCGVWRNYWQHGGRGSGTQTDGNWFHLDQAFHEKPGLDTIQGFLNFFATNPASGSTVMCLRSHFDFEQNCAGKPRKGSFVRLTSSSDLEYCRERAVMVTLKPGDLCLW
jgi:hypothetical protein